MGQSSAGSTVALGFDWPHIRARARLAELWRERGLHSGLPLGEEIARGVKRAPETRMTFGSREHPSSASIAEIYRDALHASGAFRAAGFKPGDVVVAQLPNRRESAVVLVAALHLGLIFVPVIHIYGPRELGFLMQQSRARALLVPDAWRGINFESRVRAMGHLPDLKEILVLGRPFTSVPCRTWTDFVDGAPAASSQRADPDEACLVCFTSGTSGEPKGVVHSHHTLGAEARTFPFFYEESDRAASVFWMLPGGHIAAVVAMLRPFLCGENSIYLDHFDTELAITLIAAHRPVCIGGVPFHLRAIFDHADPSLLRSVRHGSTGGAGVPPQLIRRGQELGIAFTRCFGLTEHPSVTSSHPSDPLDERASTDGKALGENAIRIVDETGQMCPPGVPGEILTMGPELFRGYLSEALNAEAFTADGWFRTGDIGIIDATGSLEIVDRKKDIIVRGGENIASREVEDILSAHPDIVEAAVVAWPDARMGEQVGAFLRLAPGADVSLEDVRLHFARSGAARQKTPEHIVIVDDFPRSPVGKVAKPKLRQQVAAMLARPDETRLSSIGAGSAC